MMFTRIPVMATLKPTMKLRKRRLIHICTENRSDVASRLRRVWVVSAPKGKATLCQAGCAWRTRKAEPAVESQRTNELNSSSAAPADHFAAYKHRRSTGSVSRKLQF